MRAARCVNVLKSHLRIGDIFSRRTGLSGSPVTRLSIAGMDLGRNIKPEQKLMFPARAANY